MNGPLRGNEVDPTVGHFGSRARASVLGDGALALTHFLMRPVLKENGIALDFDRSLFAQSDEHLCSPLPQRLSAGHVAPPRPWTLELGFFTSLKAMERTWIRQHPPSTPFFHQSDRVTIDGLDCRLWWPGDR